MYEIQYNTLCPILLECYEKSRQKLKRISFFADQYVNLVGWGLDYKSEIQAYERTNALQVMSLSVNAKDD